MKSLNFPLPDVSFDRIVSACCELHNYEDNHGKNETREQFARRMILDSVKHVVVTYESDTAAKNAVSLDI